MPLERVELREEGMRKVEPRAIRKGDSWEFKKKSRRGDEGKQV